MVEGKSELDRQVELLKQNHKSLHDAVWGNHRASWMVTSIFIPVLFAMFGFLVKEYNGDGYTNLQAVMAFLAMEGLLLVWYAIMLIFDHYNDVRREQLYKIEDKLKELVPDADFNIYRLDYDKTTKWYQIPMGYIYLALACFYTVLNAAFLVAKLVGV